MSLFTAEEMTNLYLYGVTTTPSNLADDSIIRPTGTTHVSVDINDYMNGPGRFASPAFFEIIKLFFSPMASGLAPGVYTEQTLRPLLGTNEAYIRQQQWAYKDGINDYAERVFIWNSVAFEIEDSALFVVDPNGDRYIENFAIRPYSNSQTESFDFNSNDLAAILGNRLLAERIDPNGIGREVEISFVGRLQFASVYTYADYQNDTASIVLPSIPGRRP